MITWYKIFQHSMHLCWYAAISQGVLIQFAVITTLQNSLCGTVEGHVFCTCPCLTLSDLGGKPTVMHVVGSAMDIFWTWATFEIYSTSNETATFNIIKTVSPQARGKVTNTSTVVGDSQKVSPPCTWGKCDWNISVQLRRTGKRGALKATETRQRKKAESAQNREEVVYCGVCHTWNLLMKLNCGYSVTSVQLGVTLFVWAWTLEISHHITSTVRSVRINYLFLSMLLTWLLLYWWLISVCNLRPLSLVECMITLVCLQ